LSFAQQRLWFIDQLEPGSSAYNVPVSLRLAGDLNRAALEWSLRQIVLRHETLRTSFPTQDGVPIQKINDELQMGWEIVDLRDLNPAEREAHARRLATEEAGKPFDLAHGPLLRVKLLQLAEQEHVLLAMLHHIVSDAWSIGVMVREFTHLYRAYVEGEQSSLPELPVQYADFSVWQREWMQGDVLDGQLGYWKEQLAAVPLLKLPTDRPRPALESHSGGTVRFELEREFTGQLNSLCRREGVTLFMSLLAAFKIVLGRYTGQKDIAVGTDVANRNRVETEGLIGFFVNELVLRTDLSGDISFQELLARVRQTTLQAYEHQDLPFEKLVEELQTERDLGRSPLFQVSLVMQNAPTELLQVPGVKVQRFDSGADAAKFDLQLVVSEDREGVFRGVALYATDLFDGSTIERLIGHVRRVLETVIRDAEQKIDEIDLLTMEEREQVVVEWNRTGVECPARCVHELMEEEAGRRPRAVALEIDGRQISYRELNERANQVAHYLRKKGVGPEVRVGVSVGRSLELVVGLLGVMKAGGAYVPLDPEHPVERLRFMMEDAGVEVLLTEERLLGEMAEADDERIAEQRRDNPERRNTLENLAYVLYTSGSTGKPKGVGIEHRSLMNYIWWARQAYELEGGRGFDFALYSSISFDLTVTSIFTPLIMGGCIHIYESEQEKENLIERVIAEDKAETVKLTPSHLSTLGPINNRRLRQLIVGGEALESQLARRVVEQASGPLVIWNEYGPTEATVACVLHRYGAEDEGRAQVLIGKAGANAQIYILDERQEPVAVGITGEIYIGGAGLARGYMNRPELTAERFVPDRFSETGGKRLYRTGDRGRYQGDGNIEYLGRQDEQVKYHGYRVELNEIRIAINQFPGIRDSVVVVEREESGQEVMVAYYVSRQEQKVGQLRAFLEESLIQETVPNFFVHLAKMPLTLNGKVNYKALPGVKEIRKKVVSGLNQVEPRTPTEEMVAGIWGQVLQMEKIGVEDNFFELGGHSLLATQVMSRVRSVLGVELPLRGIFEAPTVQGLAQAIERQRQLGKGVEVLPIGRADRSRQLPLSFAQQRLWFIDQLEPGSSAYNMPFGLKLTGRVDRVALQASIREIVLRHEVLRTSFPADEGIAVQRISSDPAFGWEYLDLKEMREKDRVSEVQNLVRSEADAPFDLAHGPLLRVKLLQLKDQEHVLLVTMHHIVSDGWSMNVMAGELARVYESLRAGVPSSLPELEIQYADYAVWQRQWLQGEVLDLQLEYWKQQLADAPELELATDFRRSALGSHAGRVLEWALTPQLSQQLKDLSRKEGVTVFMTLMACWQLLLSRYTGQEDVTVGTPVMGRRIGETEALIGFFVNTLVLRTRLSRGTSFRELLKQVRETTLDAYAHQDIPFEKLVEELQPKRQLNRTPFFQVMFSWMNAPKMELELPGLKLEQMSSELETSKFEIVVAATESGEKIQGAVSYRTALYKEGTIRRMMDRFERLLAEVVRDADCTVDDIPLLSMDDRRQLLVEWNQTEADYPQKAVHQLFEQQAGRNPEAVAIVSESERLNYGELNRRANQLAAHLQKLGVRQEMQVGVCAERSPAMVVALLAILKAGGAYVPLDPEYPTARLASMLEDSDIELVLSQHKFLDQLSFHRGRTIALDQEWKESESQNEENSQVPNSVQNLAYVMYTSGSTGRPKGTMITHEAIVRLVMNTDYVQVQPSDRMANISNPSFDAATFEIWGALLNGASLVVMPKEIAISPLALARRLEEENVSVMFLTTALFNHVAREVPWAFRGLRSVLFGGETADPQWSRKILADAHPRSLLNVYGPTEATTFSTWFEIGHAKGENLPIGRPLKNTTTYALRNAYELVPVGTVGELCIGGPGLARGYVNQPALTAERFVPNPYSAQPGSRLYRTGDDVKQAEDGVFEFVGRRDQQIKLRGYRIELSEIEAVLNRHEAVDESCVLLWGETSDDKRLVAYVVAKAGSGEPHLREYLRERLPDYSVPGSFVFLETLPLTLNGKIDRKALPTPESARDGFGLVHARTPVEATLTGIWCEVLKLQNVSVEDNFFDLGGHSLLATQLMSRIRQECAMELPLRLLFESPTIAGLAAHIEQRRQDGTSPQTSLIQRVGRRGSLPLSFAQQRLWFIDQLEPGSAAYNVPFGLKLVGSVDADAVKQSVQQIVKRHEVLRTTFATEEGVAVQKIENAPVFGWEEVDLISMGETEGEAEARKIARLEAGTPFDLGRGPLLRMKLLHLPANEHVLLVNMHHIVSDGWSVGIMVREFAQYYGALVEGQEITLPKMPIQYADFAVWQREWLQGEVLEKQLRYWKKQLSDVPPLELNTDRSRSSLESHRGERIQLEIGQELTNQLNEAGRREGATLFMTLLASLQVVLSRYTGQTDITVGTDIANRNRVETEGLIGFFVNELVMRTDLSGDPSLRELLSRVKQTALQAYENQDVPFEKLVEELQPERDLGRSPFFQVSLVLQNTPEKRLKLPGVEARPFDPGDTRPKLDLELVFAEDPEEGLKGSITYATDLFDRSTIERFAGHLSLVLRSVAFNSEQRISEVNLLSAEEQLEFLAERNQTKAALPQRCVQELFEQQVERTPETIAVECDGKRISYHELNARANQLAGYLRDHNVMPEVRVGVFMRRSVELLVGFLGILKAGGVYVPLDPDYPAERLRFMVDDANVAVLLTFEEMLPFEAPEIPMVSLRDWEPMARCSAENPELLNHIESLAYVMYTSGSTGKPKGAMIEQRGMVNHLRAKISSLNLTAADCVAQNASSSFDISVWQFLAALLVGARVCIINDDAARDPWKTLTQTQELGVTVLETVPTMLAVMLAEQKRAGSDALPLRRLRCLISNAEALPAAMCGEWLQLHPHVQLINTYGATECSDDTCHCWISERLPETLAYAPLGSPIMNTTVYVLDQWQQLVPIGVAGEIYIGGICLGRGYLDQPAITAEKFVPNPFSDVSGERLYRTGDRGRGCSDGSLQFTGRADHQLKIRGHRIELGEIEAALNEHPGVEQAIVIPVDDTFGGKELLGCMVLLQGEGKFETKDIRSHLAQQLPDYMVPATLLELPEFPLTPSGKVDRKALAALRVKTDDQALDVSRNLEEEILSGIFSEVLGRSRVGTGESFFELGGHSLLATQIISRVRTVFKVELPLRTLFESPTVAGMAVQLRAARGLSTADMVQIPRATRGAKLPLSFAQQRLWVLDQLEPGSVAYNIPFGVRLQGTLNKQVLHGSLEEIVRRHEILRTSFPLVDGEPVQRIAQEFTLAIEETDLTELAGEAQEEEVKLRARAEAAEPFNLAKGPLVRLKLLQLSEQEHVLLVNMHHIVSDGWSAGIIMQEFTRLYEAGVKGEVSPLPELPIQYADFALWQRDWLQGPALENHLQYWTRQLAESPVLELPTDRPRPALPSRRGASVEVEFPSELKPALEALSRRFGTTLYMTLLTAFQVLLGRYSGQTDVVVGVPIAGRTHTEIEPLIGMFFNVLALRTDLSGNPTVQELLGRVRETALEGYAHQELPFERLVAELALERNLSYSPLFQIIFEMNNTPQDTRELPGLRIEKMWTEYGVAKVDLTLSMFDSPTALSGTVQFSTDLFDSSTIERLMRHYVTLLGRMAGDAGQRLSELELLTEGERREVVGEWNQTGEDYGEAVCLQELFEEQAERTPEEAAVVWEGKGMSYGELEKRSNQLGHYLRKQGVGPEARVGLCVGRSPEMVVGLLGILKAGGAYVALDGSYPKERVAFMVEDAQVSVVLTEARLLEKLPASEEQRGEERGEGKTGEGTRARRKPQVVCLDQEWEKIAGERESRPESGVTAENMAYIYYTSGSTGKPKGVVMAHAGIVNYMRWGVEAYEARAGKGAAVHSSIAVDLTLTNFLPLFAGKTMVLVEEKPGVEGLVKLLRQKPGWSLLKLTPTHLTLLNGQLTAEEKRASTRVLVIGADNLVAEPTLAWRKEAPEVKLLNEYGPTETVVGCSIYRIGEGSPRQGGMPIGKPIANMTMYVLDTYGQPLPVGVPGELYIGGIGVARGYWGRSELTAEKFVPDGLGGAAGARFYRTGDRARFLEDGNIEFLGRLDHQVKIRGYRVEPGEVEAVLSGCRGVQKAMVVVREDTPGDKRLVGYVAAPGGGVEVKELRQYLKERLPEYMVPVAWVIMEELPVRGSGKIDPKDLPRPEMEGSQGKSKEEGPRTEVERALAGIWEEVLGVKQVGIHDNFFELGGDSILSIQVITRAREAGLGLQPRQMFERQTIAELAEVVGSESAQVEAEQGLVNGEVELTPIQRAFFEWELVKPEHYNQSVLLEVGRGVDTAVLEEAMVGLLDQHDGLRMRYEEREGEGWRQWCEAEVLESVYERKDLSWIGDEEEQRAELERDAGEVQGSLDIKTGRVVRVVEYELGEERGKRLLLTVHHLVMDGVSWRILLEDLEQGYGQRQGGEELSLGMKTTSYQQWAEKLRQYGESDAVRQEMEYWGREERKRAGRLPRDEEAAGEAANLFGTQRGVTVWLEEEETRKLLQEVPGVYQTQINDVLLTALGRVCGEWSGSEAVLVDLEGHGREDIFAEVDISRTVGWFTAMYPVLLEVGEAGQWEPGAALSGTKEQLRGVPRRGIGYGALRYGRGNGSEAIRQRLEEMPQAEISFNYLGQIDQILQGSKLFRPGRERIGSESAAENPRQHVLAVSGIVVQGKLQMDWNYSGKLHRRETIAALAERYLDCLRQLIAHCLTPDAGGFTPSDFDLAKMTPGALRQVAAQLDD
jgi:amino acid adenylation domain-containing protein/non-ribosomal peptide synthase protein (TIGR01720 family)